MKKTGFFFVCLLALMLPAFGGDSRRIAVVNLEKVFREFYKSRIAEEAIRQQSELFRNYVIRGNEELRKALQEQKGFAAAAQNVAVSEFERKNAAESAKKKAVEIQTRRAQLELYTSEKTRFLRDLERKKRAEIMVEILAEVDRRAVAEGYDFVLDSSGRSFNEQPVVLRYPSGCEITGSVIHELNRTRTNHKDDPGSKEKK